MFVESISRLTTDQRHALEAEGITRQLLWKWKHGERLPTEPQAAIYAEIAGIPRHALQDELALLRATPEQRTLLERILGKAKAGVAASFVLAASVFVGLAASSTTSLSGLVRSACATMYRLVPAVADLCDAR